MDLPGLSIHGIAGNAGGGFYFLPRGIIMTGTEPWFPYIANWSFPAPCDSAARYKMAAIVSGLLPNVTPKSETSGKPTLGSLPWA